MPGLYRIRGFLIYFWANESAEPVHVHVAKGRQSPHAAKFWILEDGRVEPAGEPEGMNAKELRGIIVFLQSMSPDIIDSWREMFGYVRFHD